MLRFQLTPDLCVPLETKMSGQVAVSVSRMRHKKTGKECVSINYVRPIAYEFEAEALADFAYQTTATMGNAERKTDFLFKKLLKKDDEIEKIDTIEMIGAPHTFTHGKHIYAQVDKESRQMISSTQLCQGSVH